MSTDSFAARLADLVGAPHVLTDPALTAGYTTDFTGRFGAPGRLVVRPDGTGEVAAVLAACADAGVAVVPQGGNTGLVGGGVPAGDEVLLSLRRLDGIGPVDAAAAQVTAGAGVTLAALQRHVRAHGLDVGVDFAARDAATLGGIVATNAGGERVLRYGTARAGLAGVEAVLADGSVTSRLGGLPKDNTGYDLTGLLAGSEGTLGVITRVRLRLVPLLTARATALLAFDSLGAAVAAVPGLRALDSLEAAEFMLPAGLALVCRHTGLPAPFAGPFGAYVLVECAGRRDPSAELLGALESLPGLADAVVAGDAADRHRLWTYRESHTEAINEEAMRVSAAATGARRGPVKLDVAVPLLELAPLITDLDDLIGPAAAYLFGHLAEGNVHVNLVGLERPAGADGAAGAAAVTDAVLARVAAAGGSISAEHGVGRAKTRWLGLSRSPAEIAAMRAIKTALDPAGLLNPGVILP